MVISSTERKSVRAWHGWLGLLHLVLFGVWLAVVLGVGKFRFAELYTDFIKDPGATTDFEPNPVGLGKFNSTWIALAVPAITALFHFLQWYALGNDAAYVKAVLERGINVYRWIEYAITAGLVTLNICIYSSMTSIILVIHVGILWNIVLQATGLLHEIMNKRNFQDPGLKGVRTWLPFAIGMVIFVAQWVTIFLYFGTAAAVTSVPIPGFVYALIIGVFLQYSLFAVVILWYWLSDQPFLWMAFLFGPGRMTPAGYDKAWGFLSAVSKTYFDAVLILGAVFL